MFSIKKNVPKMQVFIKKNIERNHNKYFLFLLAVHSVLCSHVDIRINWATPHIQYSDTKCVYSHTPLYLRNTSDITVCAFLFCLFNFKCTTHKTKASAITNRPLRKGNYCGFNYQTDTREIQTNWVITDSSLCKTLATWGMCVYKQTSMWVCVCVCTCWLLSSA